MVNFLNSILNNFFEVVLLELNKLQSISVFLHRDVLVFIESSSTKTRGVDQAYVACRK